MTCDKCISLISGTRIKIPKDLERAITKADDAVKRGVLKYEGAGVFGDPFVRLSRGGDWSDFVSNYFSCQTCGQLFHLHAETYHGSGGAFEKVDLITEPLQGDSYVPLT
ncbi:hypothetical protein [Silvimonas sp.]|uniref:hypothetical protein n=1 Tax=Silvimonas sp. TaxID=2650811 RepID=UPI002852D0F4|nr:hypothetical protein [Silvimonas sp.]